MADHSGLTDGYLCTASPSQTDPGQPCLCLKIPAWLAWRWWCTYIFYFSTQSAACPEGTDSPSTLQWCRSAGGMFLYIPDFSHPLSAMLISGLDSVAN